MEDCIETHLKKLGRVRSKIVGDKKLVKRIKKALFLFGFVSATLATLVPVVVKSSVGASGQSIRLVRVNVSGEQKSFYTSAQTVDEAVQQGGIEISQTDKVSPSRDAEITGEGTEVTVDSPHPVTIVDEGKIVKTTSFDPQKENVLSELNISLHEGDNAYLTSPLDEAVVGAKVCIERKDPYKSGDFVTEMTDMPFETIYENSSSLLGGTEKVKQEGTAGKREQRFKILYRDGIESGRIAVEEKILNESVNKIVLRGTRPKPQVPSASTGAPSGTIVGYATWYGPGFHGKGTASGEVFDQNAMTAAHRTLPFGTLVRVTYLATGAQIVVRINDRGPFSRAIIDLSAGAKTVLGMPGSGMVSLEIL